MTNLKQIPEATANIPKYGVLLSAALHLVPLALEVSQAGIVGCDALTILISHLHTPLDAGAQGLTMTDLTAIRQDLDKIQAIFNTAIDQVNHLQPSDLQIDARLKTAVTTFHVVLPELQKALSNAQDVMSVAPILLGIDKPASYLIEQMDSTELRPGGGFVGSYGILTVSGGRVATVHMQDTYLLDQPYEYKGNRTPYPPAYKWFSHYLSPESWNMRDVSLDADFPTAAHYAEQLYSLEGGTGHLDGVLAITPAFIENALKITGPIYVSEYKETISADNLIDRIHYHQLDLELNSGDIPSADGHSSLRKRFTELLFEHFLARVRQMAPTTTSQFVNLLRNSLHTKDIQIYLNANAAEDTLRSYQLASTIQAPAGDSLFVVDSNVVSNKANKFITYTLQDRVTLDTSGNATHHAKLTYNWPLSIESLQNNYGGRPNLYLDHVNIYTPPGSRIQTQEGWVPQGTSQELSRQIQAGVFTLIHGDTGTISLTWTVPHAAIKDTHGWHYRDLIQRQAGIVWHLDLQIIPPSCATQSSSLLGINNTHSLSLQQDITADTTMGVNYTCSK